MSQSLRPVRRWLSAIAVTLAAVLVTASCSDDNNDGSGTAAPSAELLGPVNRASGAPIRLGFISDGRSAALDNSAEIDAARAAASYVNEHLGGLAGRPIELVVCETHATPAQAQDCANQMARERVPAVLTNSSAQIVAVERGVTAAGIPLVAWAAPGLRESLSYSLSGGIGSLVGAPARVVKDAGFTRSAVILIDIPAAKAAFGQLAQAVFTKAGSTQELVAIPPGTPDPTAQIQAALSKDPQLLNIVGEDVFCTAVFRALKTLNYKGEILGVTQCFSSATVEGVPGGLEGISKSGALYLSDKNPDYNLFSAVIDQYAPGTEKSGLPVGGYGAVVGLARALTNLRGEVTPETIRQGLETAPPAQLPVSGGITFQCNRKAIALSPPSCTAQTLVQKLDKDGNAIDNRVLDTAELFQVG